MKTKKIEYVVALSVLLGCLIVSSAQAETLNSEGKAIENQSAVDQNTAPLSPSSTIPFELIGTPPEKAPSVGEPPENAPSVSEPIVPPKASIGIEPIVSPSEPIGVQKLIAIILAITVPLGFALGYAVRAGISARRHAVHH